MRNVIIGVSLLAVLVSSTAPGQGYYVSRRIDLPDTSLLTQSLGLPISPNREDVKAIGMGKAQIANGKTFNAMMYNPALLSRRAFRFDVVGLQASLPRRTLSAIDFLSKNKKQFETGLFFHQINDGVSEFNSATTIPQRNAAIQKINAGLKFLNDLQADVLGSDQSPQTHGLGIIPNIQLQLGNWGFSLFANAQSGFQVQPGQTISEILSLQVPEIPENPDQSAIESLIRLAGIVLPLFNPNTGQLDIADALPVAFAVAYADIVGAVGYAHDMGDGLSIGANLKVVNRRFSTKRIAADNLDEIASQTRKDFLSSVTGVTFDLGALYKIESTGTEVGLSLQNVIPVQKISSTATANFDVGALVAYDTTAGGNYVINPTTGDTGLVAVHRKIKINVPFDLKTPFIANVGVVHPVMSNWDVAFDWVDIASQDERYEKYIERFRIGTEYRLDAIAEKLGIALRAGFSDDRPSIGLGLNLFRIVQIDGAIARDNFTDETSYFAQLKIGW